MLGIPGNFDDETVPVGIRFLPATIHRPTPLRVLYPTVVTQERSIHGRRAGWFSLSDQSAYDYFLGYGHIAIVRADTWLFQIVVRPLAWVLSLRWLKISGLSVGTPLRDPGLHEEKYPILIFSHGLTGTGQKNLYLCKRLAQLGIVVVSIHHTDGSSNKVLMGNNKMLWYQHGPLFKNYNRDFRPNQIQHRCNEVFQAYRLITGLQLHNGEETEEIQSFLSTLHKAINPTKAIAAGFSFGATTAVEVVSRSDSPFSAAILLDGWYHIDVQESAGISFDMPTIAFESESVKSGRGLKVPCLFVGSMQFQTFPGLCKATHKLIGFDAAKGKNESFVLPNSGHQNFCDIVFWLPHEILKRIFSGAIGSTNPYGAYKELLSILKQFVTRHFQMRPLPGDDGQRRRHLALESD